MRNIHIDQHAIQVNHTGKGKDLLPPIVVMHEDGSTTRHMELEIRSGRKLVGILKYQPSKPLRTGARLWLEVCDGTILK